MATLNNNLKTAVVSAIAALTLTLALSWTFVDSTSIARVAPASPEGVMASVTALVR
jgi:hypothetical protein